MFLSESEWNEELYLRVDKCLKEMDETNIEKNELQKTLKLVEASEEIMRIVENSDSMSIN